MRKQSENTAILVFSRSAQEESRHKSFVHRGGYRQNLVFAQALRHQLQKVVTASGLPIIWSTEKNQVGTTFGERLQNAITKAFTQGYEQLIIVGNDCPVLSTHHLRTAKQQISPTQIVLGPALDGGTYLIGLHKSHFEGRSFGQLPWQSPELFQTMQQVVAERGIQIATLSPERDIDSAADLKLLYTSAKARKRLELFFAKLGFQKATPTSFQQFYPLSITITTHPFRGPPC